MDFNIKMGTLCIGTLLVSVAGRMFIDGGLVGVPIIIGVLFLMGQSITRFEDFPKGQQGIAQLETWLLNKRNLLRRANLPEQSQDSHYINASKSYHK